ncbi:MAG: hypothetical protein V4585_12080 [Bacteroidota bacterium]|jgi:hypothetical protein
MRKTLGVFYEEISQNVGLNESSDFGIEMVNDEAAQEVRGGDKDYTPMYENEPDGRTKWFFPSVLLNA